MSTILHPAQPQGVSLTRLIEETRQKELASHLTYLLTTIASLRTGLTECLELLRPFPPGNTLVLSSSKARLDTRNESIKGYVTRLGPSIIRADLRVNMPSLRSGGGRFVLKDAAIAKGSSLSEGKREEESGDEEAKSLVPLTQLTELHHAITRALTLVEVPAWPGNKADAHYVRGQIRLLNDTLEDSQSIISGSLGRMPWPHCPGLVSTAFAPTLPANLHADVFVSNACITLELRTLEPVDSLAAGINSLTSKFSTALGTGPKSPLHDEVGKVFEVPVPEGVAAGAAVRSPRGGASGVREVRVREKIVVESADPHLLAVRSKVDALKRNVEVLRWGLDVLMGYVDDRDHG